MLIILDKFAKLSSTKQDLLANLPNFSLSNFSSFTVQLFVQFNDISQLIKGTNTPLDDLANVTDVTRIKKVLDTSIRMFCSQSCDP